MFAGPATLVANGEIYNYRELRAAMPGVSFATNSDCEPPLHLWLRDGAEYANQLRGMYAIAIHERVRRTVTLSRDPFGIKPLYIAQVQGGLAFASEPQALLEAGLVRRAVRPAAVEELLQLQFTTGADTIFDGIQRVLPGETITCSDGHIIDRHRINPIPALPPEEIDEDTAMRRLDAALLESVDLHQRSDVPYGMFLSGGIDSSVLITLMARLNDQPVLAFTAGFDAPGSTDERDQAAAIAKAVGAKHESVEVTEAMVWRHLPEIVGAMDDPTMDYAIIPSWFLARRARQDVKVVLTGEGGDEIFGGYKRYRQATLPWWRGGKTMWAGGSFDRVPVLRERPTTWRDGMAAAEARAAEGGRSVLAAAQALDMADWLPHDLLLKLDSCMMAHARRGADSVHRPRRDGGGVPAAGCDETAGQDGQVDPAQMAGEESARRRSRSRRRRDSRCPSAPGSRTRARGWALWWRRSPAWRRSLIRRRWRRCSATSAAGGTASPAGSCCSMRCGTGGISRACSRRGMCSRRCRRGSDGWCAPATPSWPGLSGHEDQGPAMRTSAAARS